MYNFHRKCSNLLLKETKAIHRLFKTRVNFKDLNFREATQHDKKIVLTLRHNVYRGLDYLADYYDYFIQDSNRRCIVGELDRKVVSFGVILFLDGRESILSQAGRVHEMYEGRGIFGALNQYLNQIAVEHGCKRRVALVETSFNKHARSERFKRSHVKITSKLHYAGVITDAVRQKMEEHTFQEHYRSEINVFSTSDMQTALRSVEIREAIFPSNRILLDFIPFQCMEENISLFKGRNKRFYSSIRTSSNDVIGLLSAGSSYKCTNPPQSYTIDIFGTGALDLESHLHFHLTKAMTNIAGEFCLQIFVEKGYIAQQLCKALIKLDIPKCDWFVSGGITTKTVVENMLK